MEIKYGKQVEIDELQDKVIDLCIFAANHEQRMLTCYNRVKKTNKISKGIALCYNTNSCKILPKSVSKHIINDHEEIYNLLDEELSKFTNERVTIVIDYSCMTKSWYYSIILYLSKKHLSYKVMEVYFSYTPSKFSTAQPPKPNSDIAPLPGKYIVPTDKPKALIVCLGYERKKAEGIIDHLDPKVSYIFVTNPALDARFVDTLRINNQNILNDPTQNIIEFPFDDLLYLEKRLTSIYKSLKNDYSIIIAPLGPKPFTFISMIMSVKYNDIDIWRVGSGSDINVYDRPPIKDKFIVSQIIFE